MLTTFEYRVVIVGRPADIQEEHYGHVPVTGYSAGYLLREQLFNNLGRYPLESIEGTLVAIIPAEEEGS